jgi:hypothetical protein
MPARSPRRTFASPFIVTIAAVPACFVSSSTPPSQPISQAAPGQPEQSDPQPNTPPPSQSPVIVANPPRPQPQPTPDTTPPITPEPTPINTQPPPKQQPINRTWTVLKTSSGCEAMVESNCPQGAMCNPPPPIMYPCPANVKLPAKIVEADGACTLAPPPMNCPPHAMCNPPRPTKVACPKR